MWPAFRRHPAPTERVRWPGSCGGLAVRATAQGTGVGGDLLRLAMVRLRGDDVEVLWCNARDTAAAFYERLGFVTHGDGFRTVTTGLPHHVMVLDL